MKIGRENRRIQTKTKRNEMEKGARPARKNKSGSYSKHWGDKRKMADYRGLQVQWATIMKQSLWCLVFCESTE